MGALRLKLDSGKRTVEVAEERVVLGRDASAQVVVKDRSVSRKHAVIERRGEDWFVVDQDSSNGTFLDGRRVTEAPLSDGQELRLGLIAVMVEIEAPPAEATVVMQLAEAREMATVLMTPPSRKRGAPAPPAAVAAPQEAPDAIATPPDVSAEAEAPAAAFDARDLPSAQPVVVEDALASVFMPQATPAASGPAHAPEIGMHVMTKILGSVAIVLAALALFFVIGAGKFREQLAKAQQSPEYIKARQEADTYRPTAGLVTAGALVNRRLAICNVGTQALRITWLAAVQAETVDQGPKVPRLYKTARFHSGYCGGAFDVVVAPGATRTLSMATTNESCQWQGEAVYFGLSTTPATGADAGKTAWYAGVPGGDAACLKIGAAQ